MRELDKKAIMNSFFPKIAIFFHCIFIAAGIYVMTIPFTGKFEFDEQLPLYLLLLIFIPFGSVFAIGGGIYPVIRGLRQRAEIAKGNFTVMIDRVSDIRSRNDNHYVYFSNLNDPQNPEGKAYISNYDYYHANVGDAFYVVGINGRKELHAFSCRQFEISSDNDVRDHLLN